MRRQDLEVTDRNEMIRIMRECDVCRLALNDNGYPYILPLNFGLVADDENIELYFHGAAKGTKFDLIARDNRASFEMDRGHQLYSVEEKGYCTMKYESVIGRGHIEVLGEDDKIKAIDLIMKQYHPEGFTYNKASLPRTAVYKLVVESMTCKIKG